MLGSYAEARGLGDLAWLDAQGIQRALADFDAVLARASAAPGAMGRYARAARPIVPLWTEPGMLWLDYQNPGYLEFDERLRLAMNPSRVVDWWVRRPRGLGSFRGDALHRAFVGFMVGLVHHDITHMMIWIAHRRLPGFHTLWLGEELNCTLWGSTMAQLAVSGEVPDLEDRAVVETIVDSSMPAIEAVHIRDYLKDRDQMLTSGPSMASIFEPVPSSMALMTSARELIPEHPGAELAYRRFADWALTYRNDPLDGGAMLRWRGAEGVTELPEAEPAAKKKPATKKKAASKKMAPRR